LYLKVFFFSTSYPNIQFFFTYSRYFYSHSLISFHFPIISPFQLSFFSLFQTLLCYLTFNLPASQLFPLLLHRLVIYSFCPYSCVFKFKPNVCMSASGYSQTSPTFIILKLRSVCFFKEQ
jgi:hypothetical protein